MSKEQWDYGGSELNGFLKMEDVFVQQTRREGQHIRKEARRDTYSTACTANCK